MTVALQDFAMTIGSPDGLLTDEKGMGIDTISSTPPQSDGPRGLVMKRITLNRDYEGPLAHILHGSWNEICMIINSIDLSGQAPYHYPPNDQAGDAFIELQARKPFSFTFGSGLPVFPARQLTGGLIATVIVTESDSGIRDFGETLGDISKQLSTDKTVGDFIAELANPTALTIDTITQGIGSIVGITSSLLEKNGNDHVGLFQGYFPARDSWDGMLSQDERGASIQLDEINS